MARDSSGPKNEPQYAGTGTPADAADMTEIAAYAAKVGNRRTDVDSVRTGLTGADLWNGLEFFSTDTGKLWVYNGGWSFIYQVPTAWASMSLTSGWTATSAGWALPQYRLNALGEVEIRGQITPKPGYSAGDVFATLPPGFRPALQISPPAVNNATGSPGMAEVVIAVSGAMSLIPAGIGNLNLGYINFATN